MNDSEDIFPNTTLTTKYARASSSHQFNKTLTFTRIAVFALIGSFIVFGNILCLAVFLRTRALRRRSYNLLINLSTADLMVGFSTCLICIEDGLTLRGEESKALSSWRFILQYMPQMCSLFTIATVAVERFWAVGFPIKHRQAGKSPYVALISIPWVLASLLSVLLTSSAGFELVSADLFSYTAIAFSQASLLTIVLCYCALMWKIKHSNSIATPHNTRSVIKERKLAKTLFLVTLASLITIYPVNIYFFVMTVQGDLHAISENLYVFLIALVSCNSGINIVVYILRIAEFKKAVYRMLRIGHRHNHRAFCPEAVRDAIPANIDSPMDKD